MLNLKLIALLLTIDCILLKTGLLAAKPVFATDSQVCVNGICSNSSSTSIHINSEGGSQGEVHVNAGGSTGSQPTSVPAPTQPPTPFLTVIPTAIIKVIYRTATATPTQEPTATPSATLSPTPIKKPNPKISKQPATIMQAITQLSQNIFRFDHLQGVAHYLSKHFSLLSHHLI